MSDAILNAIGGGGPVLTKGLAWQEPNAQQFIPTNRLVSKILCEEHNSRLSPLDSEASRLFRFLQKFHSRDKAGIPKSAEVNFDGPLVERWMLKSICGFVASNTSLIHFPDRTRSQKPSDWWIDMLFGLSPIFGPLGLHFFGGSPPSTNVEDFSSGLQYTPLEQEDIGVYGGIFNLYTPRFLMSLASPPPQLQGTLLEHAVRHPIRIVLNDGELSHSLNLSWPKGDAGRPITVQLRK